MSKTPEEVNIHSNNFKIPPDKLYQNPIKTVPRHAKALNTYAFPNTFHCRRKIQLWYASQNVYRMNGRGKTLFWNESLICICAY